MPVRFRIVALITLGTMINYIDRVNISVAASDIMRDTGWDAERFGFVFSAFLVGYALFQYPGGALADRWSARRVVALSCIGFSIFTLLTPLGQHAFLLLIVLRFLVGGSEALSFPSFASMNSRWIPRSEFARAQAWLLAGIYLGQMIAFPLTTRIIAAYSWQMVFYVNAFIGVAWVATWMWYSRDTPRDHSGVSAAELETIERDLAQKKAGATVSFLSIVRCPTIIYLCMSYMILGFVAWLFIFWFPTYLTEERGLTLMQMGTVGMLPTGAGFFGVLIGGWMWDALLKKGWSARTTRVRLPGLCMILSAPCLVAGVLSPDITVALVCFVLFYFAFSLSLAGYWALPLELNARFVGSVTGVMNTSGNLAGLFGPVTAGVMIARTGSYELPFLMAAGLAVICGLIYALFVTTDPIEIETQAPDPTAAAA